MYKTVIGLKLKLIAYSFKCFYSVIAKFLAKFTDVHINSSVSYHNIFPPYFMEYIFSSENLAGLRCKQSYYFKLLFREINLFSAYSDAVIIIINTNTIAYVNNIHCTGMSWPAS